MATWPGWDRDLLTALRAPINADTLRYLDTWQSYEGGGAVNNPLNTTQPEPGATNYNSVGVKNYVSSTQGTTATVTTLENGRYPDILGALRSGKPFAYGNKGAVASQIDTWGTFAFAAWYMQQGIATQPGATPPATGESQSFHGGVTGWQAFNRSLATTMPTMLKRSRVFRREALRHLR